MSRIASRRIARGRRLGYGRARIPRVHKTGDGGVSVDSFWKRVPAAVIAGHGPAELSDLVPYWFDDQFKVETANGTVVGAEDTGALIDVLLRAGARTDSEKAAARVFGQPPSGWNRDYMVATLATDVVRQVSSFLSDAPLERWVVEHRSALADRAQSMGYRRPFDDEWARQLLSDAQEVAALFRAAAAADEAIIMKLVA
jgi:hypothetical protein